MDPYEPITKNVPRVPEFYSGKSVFVTGFTGFLGKTLIEKMLWTSADAKKIFVLLRGRKNKSAVERLEDILNLDCFDRIRKRDGESFKNKFVAVEGDLAQPGLGISAEMRSQIISEVNIIFHVAATVRFDEPLSIAFDTNFKGTKFALDLALEVKNLEAFTHISTAYCNSNRLDIKEQMYDPVADWQKTLLVRNKIDEATINILSDKYKGSYMVNTYVFTKHLAEHLVVSYQDRLPVVIIRPTIVANSFTDPIPGYNENFNGPIGMIFGIASGLVRTQLFIPEAYNDYVQCDIVNKLTLLATLLRPYQKPNFTAIYNSSTMQMEVNKPEVYFQYGQKIFDENPLKVALWAPSLAPTRYKHVFYTCFILFQLIPCLLFDLVSRITGNVPRLVTTQRRIYTGMLSIKYFIFNSFVIHNEKGHGISKYMHPEDQEEMSYIYEEKDIDYLKEWGIAFRYMCKKFFKQTQADYESAKRKLLVFKVADKTIKYGLMVYGAWYIYINGIVLKLCYNIFNFFTLF